MKNMKVLGINGSPRKNWNTATLLENALKGSESMGAQTETIHLYDLVFTGCTSCFACKRVNGNSYGKCAVKDDLALVLKKIEEADAIVLGSPIYFGDVSGEVRSLLERLFFQYLVYDKEHTILTPKRIPTLLVFTMNAPEESLEQTGVKQLIIKYEKMFGRFLGETKSLTITDTLQFDDYSKYVSSMFNVEERNRRHEEVFPKECEIAFTLGAELTGNGL